MDILRELLEQEQSLRSVMFWQKKPLLQSKHSKKIVKKFTYFLITATFSVAVLPLLSLRIVTVPSIITPTDKEIRYTFHTPIVSEELHSGLLW
jgi:hypothetical protein